MNKEELSAYFKEIGAKGGKKSAEVNKGKHSEWGKKGGRPRKLTAGL